MRESEIQYLDITIRNREGIPSSFKATKYISAVYDIDHKLEGEDDVHIKHVLFSLVSLYTYKSNLTIFKIIESILLEDYRITIDEEDFSRYFNLAGEYRCLLSKIYKNNDLEKEGYKYIPIDSIVTVNKTNIKVLVVFKEFKKE